GIDERLDVKIDSRVNEAVNGLNIKLNAFDQRLDENSSLFKTVLTPTKLNVGKDLGIKAEMDELRAFETEMESFHPGTRERAAAEKKFVEKANVITERLNTPTITGDVANAIEVNAALAEVHGGLGLIMDERIKVDAAAAGLKANNITRSFRINR